MEEDSKENGTKKPSIAAKSSRSGGLLGSGMAMKIPKQPTKNTGVPKKGRQTKLPKEGASDGSNQPRNTREGRRNTKDDKHRLSPSNSHRQGNDQHGSRHSSASPVGRKDDEDGRKQPDQVTKIEPSLSLTDIEATSENLKQLLFIGGSNLSRIVYSRIQLLNISENPSSKSRPDCLETDFNATNGRWDPETWHRSLSSPPVPSASTEKLPKFSLPESRDRFSEDAASSGIILGPQRRSFQDGCHVTSTSSSRSSLKLHLNSTTETTSRHARPRLVIRQRSEVADYEGPPAGSRERQIESASALRTEEFDWDRRGDSKSRYSERDLSDLRPEPRRPRDLPKNLQELRSGRDNDRDFKDVRDRDYRDRKYSHSREYGNERGNWYQSQPRERRERRYSNNEPEPEWYTDGPTSQSDTIDLAGFTEDTPAAAADFSSWGGGIPLDDSEEPVEETENADGRKNDVGNEKVGDSEEGKREECDNAEIIESTSEENTDVAGLSAVMEEILKDDSSKVTNAAGDASDSLSLGAMSSRFSQWFQRDFDAKESGSGVSTPHEELENIAASTAEQGLASPVELEGNTQLPSKTNELLRYLTHIKATSGNLSSGPDASEQQEILRQQMKLGSVVNVADIEASAGARHSPSQSYGGVDVQNTDAFNKLVASIREKDKIRLQQQLLAQQALLQEKNLSVGRIPSPDDLASHGMLQQSLIKKQLEMQKEAYHKKVQLMDQHRRQEQLREAIRRADAGVPENKRLNKSLSFMPTSVMRKMQESREGKMPGDEMIAGHLTRGDADDLATATASFSAKLANSGKKLPTPSDQIPQQSNDLLARIYQSAAQTKHQEMAGGLRRNASYPEVLMDANKLARSSAFHQPPRQSVGTSNVDADATRLRLMELQSAGLLHRSKSGNLAVDICNNNLLKSDGGNYDRTSPRNHMDVPEKSLDAEMEMKYQHEVAALTQNVLKQIGITEDQLSRLTPQQQHTVVQIIQNQFYDLQARKRATSKKSNPVQNLKFTKSDVPGLGKQVKLDDHQNNPNRVKPVTAIPPNSLGIKFAPQTTPGIPGVTAPGPIPGMLPPSNPQLHPYQLRVAQPLPFIQPLPRAPVVPAFLPPQTHLPGRILTPNVPLASPIANPAAATLLQMQLLQQQQQRMYAAIQHQQLQALAAARQKDNREFNNPLERWFTRDMLSQSQLPANKPPMHNHPTKE